MSNQELMHFAAKADGLSEEAQETYNEGSSKSDELFAGLVGGESLGKTAQMAPMSAQMASTFVRLENLRSEDGSRMLVKGSCDLREGYELQLFQKELGTNSSQIKVMTLCTSNQGECFTEDIDYGDRMKKHLDYLCDKYEVFVVPREITGFSTYSCTPDSYVPIQVHGKCLYSATGIRQTLLREELISELKAQLVDQGSANISLLKVFQTEVAGVGISHTLLITLDEITYLAETFAGYNPVLIETDNDYMLYINPITIPTELM